MQVSHIHIMNKRWDLMLLPLNPSNYFSFSYIYTQTHLHYSNQTTHISLPNLHSPFSYISLSLSKTKTTGERKKEKMGLIQLLIIIVMLLPLLAPTLTFSSPLPDPELVVQEVNE